MSTNVNNSNSKQITNSDPKRKSQNDVQIYQSKLAYNNYVSPILNKSLSVSVSPNILEKTNNIYEKNEIRNNKLNLKEEYNTFDKSVDEYDIGYNRVGDNRDRNDNKK